MRRDGRKSSASFLSAEHNVPLHRQAPPGGAAHAAGHPPSLTGREGNGKKDRRPNANANMNFNTQQFGGQGSGLVGWRWPRDGPMLVPLLPQSKLLSE